MKFICNTADISVAVNNVGRAVSQKTSMPALEGILIEAKDEGIVLSGYDLEIAIKTEVKADVQASGSTVLGAKILGEILRKLSEEIVIFELTDKNNISIKSGVSEFSIVALDAGEFPELPAASDAQSISIETDMLVSMVNQTIYAVSTSEIRPVHTGVLFEIEKGEIRLIGVDGCRLAVRKEKINTEQKMRFIIPARTLSEIIKLAQEQEEKITFNVGKRHVSFDVGDFFVISRLLEGDFLDWRGAIPKGALTTVKTSVSDMIRAIERISLVITDRLKSPVKCTFKENSAFLKSATIIGTASDFIECEVQGSEVEVGYNNKFFIDALRNTGCDQVIVELNGATSPIKIRPLEGDEFLFLVVPVRLKAEN